MSSQNPIILDDTDEENFLTAPSSLKTENELSDSDDERIEPPKKRQILKFSSSLSSLSLKEDQSPKTPPSSQRRVLSRLKSPVSSSSSFSSTSPLTPMPLLNSSSTIFGGGLDDDGDILFSLGSTDISCASPEPSEELYGESIGNSTFEGESSVNTTIIQDNDENTQSFICGESDYYKQVFTSLRRRVKERAHLNLDEWSEYIFMGLLSGHLNNE